MDHVNTVLALLSPYLVELIAAAILFAVSWVGTQVRTFLGTRTEQILRDALHQAINTGLNSALQDIPRNDAKHNDEIVKAAVAYAKQSVPQSIQKLGATENILVDLAKSKLLHIVGSTLLKR